MIDRSAFLGGSDAAAVMGLSRWKTPLSVWSEKTGLVKPKESDAEYLELGRELEDYVAKRFMRKANKKVRRVNEQQYHPQYPFIAAQIDRRVVGEDAILECKTASAWKRKEWQGQDIPREYIIQVMHQLAVTGASIGYIAVLVGNSDFIWKIIPRDEDFIKTLISKEVAFWNDFVLTKIPPAVTADDADTLLSLFPEATPSLSIPFDDDATRAIEQIEAMQQDAFVLEREIELRKNQLKKVMGEAEVGETDRYRVTWRNQVSSRVDAKRLRTEYPDIADKVQKESISRVFSIRQKKDEEKEG